MVALSLQSRGYRKYLSLGAMIVFEAVLFASGYRLLWAAGVCVPLFVAYFSTRGARKGLRLLAIGAITLLLLAVLIFIARSFFPDVYARVAARFSGIFNLNFSSNLRYFAWQTAWSKFLTSPIVGVGIGDQFQYIALSSSGRYYISTSTTHNIIMSLLYQTGIVGAGLFLAIHFLFVYYIWRRMSRLAPRARVIILGMLAGYLAALVVGMLQPVFEAPGAIVMFYLWMGLILNLLRMFTSVSDGQ
jgi:O-antigen ligase